MRTTQSVCYIKRRNEKKYVRQSVDGIIVFFCADCARLQNAERIATEFDEKLNTER